MEAPVTVTYLGLPNGVLLGNQRDFQAKLHSLTSGEMIMQPLIDKKISFRLETAKRLANRHNTHEPEIWMSKIDEVERLLNNGQPVEKILELFLFYSLEQMRGLPKVLDIAARNDDLLKRPPLPVINDLSAALEDGIVVLGSKSIGILLKKYYELQPNEVERLLILRLMAKIGDPNLKIFVRDLKKGEILPALASENAILMQNYGNHLPVSDDIFDIEEEGQKFLDAIRTCYEQALAQQKEEPPP